MLRGVQLDLRDVEALRQRDPVRARPRVLRWCGRLAALLGGHILVRHLALGQRARRLRQLLALGAALHRGRLSLHAVEVAAQLPRLV